MATAKSEQIERLKIDDLEPSPTNPRTAYDQDSLEELAESITSQGVIQPLIVRPNGKKYEIAAGHRRYYASIKAGLETVPCVVRVMDDDQIVDNHIHENLHREDLSPIDEARTYKLMRDRGATLAEVVARSGKGEGYVTRRLKLTDLLPEIQQDVAEGHLPMTIAMELAKFPAEAQTAFYPRLYGVKHVTADGLELEEGMVRIKCLTCGEILVVEEEGADDIECSKCEESEEWEWVEGDDLTEIPDKTNLEASVQDVSRFMANEWVNRLNRAIFPLDDPRLREDGLICPKCPERTGANAGLFGDVDAESDACLNRTCFIAKGQKFVQLTREAVAKEKGVEVETVPIIQTNYGPAAEGVIPRNGYEILDFRPKDDPGRQWGEPDEHCEFEIAVVGDNGATGVACLTSSGCQIHHWQNRPQTAGAVVKPTESEEEKKTRETEIKQNRKEEIWNVKIGEAVRREVFQRAAVEFGKQVYNQSSLGRILYGSMPAIVSRMWETEDQTHVSKVIEPIIKALTKYDELPNFTRSWSNANQGYIEPEMTRQQFVEKFVGERKAEMLFLFTHGFKGAMFANAWTDQTPVKELATAWDVNYKLVDAQVRVELSSKKAEKVHKAYLQQVEVNDPQAKVPRLYSENWTPPEDRVAEPATVIDEPEAIEPTQVPETAEIDSTQPPVDEFEPMEREPEPLTDEEAEQMLEAEENRRRRRLR